MIRSIFLTHHHPDHNIEYGSFLVIGWVQGLSHSVRTFGPPPLKQMTEDFLRAYKSTIDFWAEDFKMKPFASSIAKVSSGCHNQRRHPLAGVAVNERYRDLSPTTLRDTNFREYCEPISF
jgi:ribonuclease BN (tRNA processing enzyme)